MTTQQLPAIGGTWRFYPHLQQWVLAFSGDVTRITLLGGRIVKRGGVIVERSVKVQGVVKDYSWGEAVPREQLERIVCCVCDKVIALGIDQQDVLEMAQETTEATFQEGPDEWFCSHECMQDGR